jgi:biotin synthase
MEPHLSQEEIIKHLTSVGEERTKLFERSAKVKEETVGNFVYLRGLIEFSNYCSKDCFYCGIRKSNRKIERYNITDEEILEAARFAYENKYGSIVLQSGELKSPAFTKRITNLIKLIHQQTDERLRITLSCGEQTKDTYQEWFDTGAKRFLLRIESSNPELYLKLHPNNKLHSFDERVKCIEYLQEIGYQTGTGVMIGLPFQTLEDMANDLLWMQKMNIDMVGMGPYLMHNDTPLLQYEHLLLPELERFDLALKMIALLRIMMPNINIAASTAMQSIDKMGREKAIKVGANVFMPNITPREFRDSYKLYDNKPCTDENAEDCQKCIEARIFLTDNKIAYDTAGDSLHYQHRD